MGYTHYFYREKHLPIGQFKPFSEDVAKIVAYCRNELKIPLACVDGKGEPVIDLHFIGFNGVEEDSCESFYIHRDSNKNPRGNDKLIFNFCKTRQRPYDVAVCAVLIALKHHFPESIIYSDGDLLDWQDGIDACMNAVGYGSDFKLEE